MAVAYQRLGRSEEANRWYEKSIEWMKANGQEDNAQEDDEELRSFRDEAAGVLGKR